MLAANKYAAEKFGIPLKNTKDAERKEKLREYIKSVKQVAQTVKIAIPYHKKLAEKYPAEKPQDMRDFKKFLSLISMQTLIHAFQRPLIKIGDEWILLSTGEDLENALDTFENAFLTTQTGVSQEILDIYNDIFAPLEGERPGYNEILEKYNEERDDPISREWLRIKVVKPLEHIGWLDVEPNPDDKRKKQFKVQGSKKTFENLCEEIKGVLDEETVKKWLKEVSKKPLDSEKSVKGDFTILKNLLSKKEVDENYLMREIANHKGFSVTPKSPSSDESGKYSGEKTKQRYSKVSQSELRDQLADLLYEEQPKVSQLQHHFDSQNLGRANEMLLSWKEQGKAKISEDNCWKLVN